MSNNAIISYFGENKPNLISDVTTYLTEKEGRIFWCNICNTWEEYANLQWFIKKQKK